MIEKIIRIKSCESCINFMHCLVLSEKDKFCYDLEISPDCPLPDYKDITELKSKLSKSEERYRLTRRTYRAIQGILAEVEKERDKLREVVDKITKYADDGYSMERHFGDNLSILNVKSLLRGE